MNPMNDEERLREANRRLLERRATIPTSNPPGPVTDGMLTEAMARLGQLAAQSAEKAREWKIWAVAQPRAAKCPLHKLDRQRLEEQSIRESIESGQMVILYRECPVCDSEDKVKLSSNWMAQRGVPELLLHCSFETWRKLREGDDQKLSDCREFVKRGKGFLVMIGGNGLGKSFLAVSAMREFGAGRFLTHNLLLEGLRKTYRDDRAEDIAEKCRTSRFLIIDDLGLSAGGRDDLPMLHGVLDYRHGARLPTVLTANLAAADFRAVIGERMADRLKQSAFKVLVFTGASARADGRDEYFG